MMEKTLRERANKTEELLASLAVHESLQVEEIQKFKTHDFMSPEELPLSEFTPISVGYRWHRNRQTTHEDRLDADVDLTNVEELPKELSLGQNVWFRLQFTIPESMEGRRVFLRFKTKPMTRPERGGQQGRYRVEALCYRDGTPWQAFDVGHDDMLLAEDADGGTEYDLLIEVATTVPWGGLTIQEFELTAVDVYSTRENVRELSRNYMVLNDLRKDISKESTNYGQILQSLAAVSTAFPFQSDAETELDRGAREGLSTLDELKETLTSDLSGYTLSTIGNNHIDLAFLWPWPETVRKSARSFANNLRVLEKYPEYKFTQSQPHLYEFARTMYPDVFSQVTEQVDEGRWFPDGALWVEADINLAGAEPLARQFLMGKRYCRETFDVDPNVLFLPDTFGYSPALPGIATAADCPYFFTAKIGWNETNEFPYTSFNWRGIDGSEIVSHFPPLTRYNAKVNVGEVRTTIKNFKESATLDEAVYPIGWGDGGGGVNYTMMEDCKIIDEIGSLPDIEFKSLGRFFEDLDEYSEDLSTWSGELYLERHRGTLTSQARTKWNNRKGEFAIRDAELWSTLAATTGDYEYGDDSLTKAWKILLFGQFHDLLPGSSVTDVFYDAERDYAEMFDLIEAETETALDSLFDRTSESPLVCVTNSLSWRRTPVVTVDEDIRDDAEGLVVRDDDGEKRPVQQSGRDDAECIFEATNVPPLGAKTFEFVSGSDTVENEFVVSEERMENTKVRIEFTEAGSISVYDKETNHTVFDGYGNELMLYRDIPTSSPAWDFEEDLYTVGEELPDPTTEVVESGPIRAIVRHKREFNDSSLTQDIVLHRSSKRIDFETRVNWYEDNQFLRARFPIDVTTDSATYETQFGHFDRPTHSNTTWDQVRYEEAHQKWLDVADHGFGAAVLNDCKYGVHVDGAEISLGLLRAPGFPDPEADRGHHEFTYSLLPHEDSIQEAGVIKEAYNLNAPIRAFPVTSEVDTSLLDVDRGNIVVESVKQAEDDTEKIVIRLYEAWGQKSEATINVHLPVETVEAMNLIEDVKNEIPITDDGIDLSFDSFEIKTIAVEIGY